MDALARCSQVLYDKQMLDNAKEVHLLRKRAKPIVTEQTLHIAITLQWILFEQRYCHRMHEICMRMAFQSLLPASLFKTGTGFPMDGIMAGVNAIFRVIRYTEYRACRAEWLFFLEHSFRNICSSCWRECLDVKACDFTPMSTNFIRQHSLMSFKEIVALAHQD